MKILNKSKIPAVITMGKMEKRPVVINDKVVIRTIFPGAAAFDHRIVDGVQIAKFVRGTIKRLKAPEFMDKEIENL